MLMYIPMNAIVIAYSFSISKHISKFVNLISPYFAGLSIINSIILFSYLLLTPSLNYSTNAITPNRLLPFGFKTNLKKNKVIREFALKSCNIRNSSQLSRLITDDHAYFALKEITNPLSSHYVLGWYSKDIIDLKTFFTNNNIPGFVLRDCSVLKQRNYKSIEKSIIHKGKMCCLNLQLDNIP